MRPVAFLRTYGSSDSLSQGRPASRHRRRQLTRAAQSRGDLSAGPERRRQDRRLDPYGVLGCDPRRRIYGGSDQAGSGCCEASVASHGQHPAIIVCAGRPSTQAPGGNARESSVPMVVMDEESGPVAGAHDQATDGGGPQGITPIPLTVGALPWRRQLGMELTRCHVFVRLGI
jgi:hypothetical protein